MTKSDAEREKEGHMTHKFLMTIAIVAIALAPSIGIGTAQAHGSANRPVAERRRQRPPERSNRGR